MQTKPLAQAFQAMIRLLILGIQPLFIYGCSLSEGLIFDGF